MQLNDLLQNLPSFEESILALIEKLGLSDLALECDHLSLRVNSTEAANQLAHDFAQIGDVISNNLINGRPILIIKLHQSLTLGKMQIPCIELPYPGRKQYPQEGWEHIELVLPCEAQTCEELTKALLERVPSLAPVLAHQTHIKVKASSPAGDAERLANPTLAFGLDGITVKIHPHSIEAIVASEQQAI